MLIFIFISRINTSRRIDDALCSHFRLPQRFFRLTESYRFRRVFAQERSVWWLLRFGCKFARSTTPPPSNISESSPIASQIRVFRVFFPSYDFFFFFHFFIDVSVFVLACSTFIPVIVLDEVSSYIRCGNERKYTPIAIVTVR